MCTHFCKEMAFGQHIRRVTITSSLSHMYCSKVFAAFSLRASQSMSLKVVVVVVVVFFL